MDNPFILGTCVSVCMLCVYNVNVSHIFHILVLDDGSRTTLLTQTYTSECTYSIYYHLISPHSTRKENYRSYTNRLDIKQIKNTNIIRRPFIRSQQTTNQKSLHIETLYWIWSGYIINCNEYLTGQTTYITYVTHYIENKSSASTRTTTDRTINKQNLSCKSLIKQTHTHKRQNNITYS